MAKGQRALSPATPKAPQAGTDTGSISDCGRVVPRLSIRSGPSYNHIGPGNESRFAWVEFPMIETCAVFKLPVCCAACGSQQYETLLRIAQATPLVCVECRERIDLRHGNSAIFNCAVAFVEGQRELG